MAKMGLRSDRILAAIARFSRPHTSDSFAGCLRCLCRLDRFSYADTINLTHKDAMILARVAIRDNVLVMLIGHRSTREDQENQRLSRDNDPVIAGQN